MAGNVNPDNYPHLTAPPLIGESHLVPTAELQPNRWNYNAQTEAQFAKLVASIKRFGFVEPVIVRRVEGGLEIVNGEHRWRAALSLGMQEIPVTDLGEMEDSKAKQLTIILNELSGDPDQARLSDLLQSIIRGGLDAADMLMTMPYSEAELAAYVDTTPMSFDQPADAGGTPVQATFEFPAGASLEDFTARLLLVDSEPAAAIRMIVDHYLQCQTTVPA